jgi:hypothetical protein
MRELAELRNGLSDFREALHPINDEALISAFREVLDAAEPIVEAHCRRPSALIADDMANLRSLFSRQLVPRKDQDLGNIPTLTALRSARGSILADFDSVLAAARDLGRIPSDSKFFGPADIKFERAGREGQLAALEQRLRRVERDLETKIAPEGRLDEGHSSQQIGLVNFYVDAMKIEITLARLETRAREFIDFIGLSRAIEAIGELTADFVATVQGLWEKVTETLRRSAQDIRPTVRRAIGGFRTMVKRIRWQAPAKPKAIGDLPGLDSRPDLLDMTPTEFEHLVRQLFEAMGMKSWNTQASKDDGVDAVAINEDPVFGGVCIIQSKQYRGAVGVEAVRALAGVMEDKHATKGIIVTTSWVTKDGHAFAARHGRITILECEELKYLCKEHLDLDVIISLPKPPPQRR